MGRKWVLVMLILCGLILAACAAENGADETSAAATVPMDTILWDVDPSRGGYTFATDGLQATYVVNGGYLSVFVDFKENDHCIELYIAPTETILMNTQAGITTLYREEYPDTGEQYTNPMVDILENLRALAYTPAGETEIDTIVYRLHRGERNMEDGTRQGACLYTDPHTGRIEKIQQIQDTDGAVVTVIHAPSIQRPEIQDAMVPMDVGTMEMAMAVIAMVETLFR